MKTINASVNEQKELITDTVNGYSGESNAEMLVVDLGPFAECDSYAVYVRTSALGAVRRLEVGTDSDDNPYVAHRKMYIRLTSELTCGGKLSIEIEGIKIKDSLTVRELTSIAQISFKPSMTAAAEQGEYKSGAETELRLLAAALAKRLTDLEEREPSTGSGEEAGTTVEFTVPYADATTVGGFKINAGSPLLINEKGFVDFNYRVVNFNHFLVNIAACMLVDYDRVTGEIGADPDKSDSDLVEMTLDVVDGACEACVYTVCKNGYIYYTDENYEKVKQFASLSSLYLFKMVDGVMTLTEWRECDILRLLKEGVVSEEN